MNPAILNTLLILTGIGAIASVILYFIAKQFSVYEDPKIDEVEAVLPNANCGGCGYPGCRAFAESCTKVDHLDTHYCPPGGNETMAKVGEILGMTVSERTPQVAVLLCNGSLQHRKTTNVYDGADNCTIAANLYGGHTDCIFGCLGLGECVDACDFDAITMDKETGLPVVDEAICGACGACVAACPRDLFQLRDKGKKNKRIFVACMSKDKGAAAKKSCDVACIGCGKCVKECQFDAIVIKDQKAYIDFEACKLCRKCVAVCPTEAIHEINFPLRKVKEDKKLEVEMV